MSDDDDDMMMMDETNQVRVPADSLLYLHLPAISSRHSAAWTTATTKKERVALAHVKNERLYFLSSH